MSKCPVCKSKLLEKSNNSIHCFAAQKDHDYFKLHDKIYLSIEYDEYAYDIEYFYDVNKTYINKAEPPPDYGGWTHTQSFEIKGDVFNLQCDDINLSCIEEKIKKYSNFI